MIKTKTNLGGKGAPTKQQFQTKVDQLLSNLRLWVLLKITKFLLHC